jgi:antitoxin (DNA-binding transcriptional repressor) of toxin-antitoxin stability system
MTIQVNIHEAKTTLSALLSKVAKGEEVIIAKSGKPTAILSKYQGEPKKRKFGAWKNKFEFNEEQFDEPISEIEEYFK